MPIEQSEETLILQAQRGDMTAFERLVQRYDQKVLSMAIGYTRDPEDAKDVYQDVFIRVFRALPKFQFRSQFSTWVYRIAANVCKTHYFRRSRRDHISLDDPVPTEGGKPRYLTDSLAGDDSADKRALRSEFSSQMNEAMTALSPKQKLVFTLRHYQGHKLREIAEIMNCAEGTVKRHLFTATRRLRDELAPLVHKEWRQ